MPPTIHNIAKRRHSISPVLCTSIQERPVSRAVRCTRWVMPGTWRTPRRSAVRDRHGAKGANLERQSILSKPLYLVTTNWWSRVDVIKQKNKQHNFVMFIAVSCSVCAGHSSVGVVINTVVFLHIYVVYTYTSYISYCIA